MEQENRQVRIAVDVGGTFTDVVKLDPATGGLIFDKVPTTPTAPTVGVLGAFDKADADPATVRTFNHGTTLGLNSLLTRRGARVAVIATKGFRDVYLLGRCNRTVSYDIKYQKPKPLLERYDTYEVDERCLYNGQVRRPFDEEDARRVAREIAAGGYESVAVAFLHAYANPDHELRMREILTEEAPEVEVSLSHELSREYREYERTSTAVLDAYIKPIIGRYLRVLEEELANREFGGHFLMSRSGGGAMTISAARDQPVNLILSGPAGGVVGAAGFSALTDHPNLITIDMGGTSLDASLVLDGRPVVHRAAEFEGLPINSTSLYIHTIGAGGGSLIYLDEAGSLQVGPASAGAEPGPASYGRGGTQPTFTDAALVMGYLGSDSPLGGELTLDADLAAKALEPIAESLGMSVVGLAQGAVQISDTKIVGAVRAITVELGHDPKDFSLLAFGGGGGLVGVDVARELLIPTVIIPPGQGAFSALGMLMADVQHDFSRTQVTVLDNVDVGQVRSLFHDMEAEADEVLQSEGFAPNKRIYTYAVDARYSGQEHTVTVPLDGPDLDRDKVGETFSEMHERQYGHKMDDPIEVTIFRLSAVGVVDKPRLPKAPARDGGAPEPYTHRSVHVRGRDEQRYAIYQREDLMRGDTISGPAVVVEHTATTVMHEGDELAVGDYGELIIQLGNGSEEN